MSPDRLARFVWFCDSPAAKLLRLLLTPLSWLFAGLARARVLAYSYGLLSSGRARVPVVSVGNISVGGTGKTPFVLWLVQRLQGAGKRVVVVSRGYGGGAACVVDASDDRPPPAGAADEALLVSRRGGCPVVTDRDRLAACALAVDRFGPDIIVVDDGFQHLRLRRDLDIVVLGGDEARVLTLPAGPLRESASALTRADVLLGPDGLDISALRSISGAKLTCKFSKRADAVVDTVAASAARRPLGDLEGRKVLAVAAIARPAAFVEMVSACGAAVVGTMLFRDHHPYGIEDWRAICAAARQADLVLTTEKDLVKLERFAPPAGMLAALRLELEVENGAALVDTIAGLCRVRPGGAR